MHWTFSPASTMHYDSIIVGAGAAGLFCAMEAGKRGRKILLIDKSKSAGDKIRISGGGRCNFTNIHTTANDYLSQNPHFCKSALGRYTPADFVELVEKHGIAYHEKTLGQLFCDGSSKEIIQMLLDECEAANVTVQLQTEVNKIEKLESGFSIQTNRDETLTCESLVIATGGPSIPKMGATDWGYRIAKQFNLAVIEPRAALVPFTLEEKLLNKLRPLAGVSFNAIAKTNNTSFTEGMLFTHRGLSGPSILQISSYWKDDDTISLNLLPEENVLELLKENRDQNPKQEIQTCLQNLLPKRVAHYLCEEYGYAGKLAEQGNKALEAIAKQIQEWNITPNGTEGYRTAEVALGGVDTNEISSKTFESKKVSDLYFIGEVVDVTGHLGGFNFQWAWASGYAAGQYI
ncbi:MAG: NAD(P)/FAD-dependent oxidoreductase [Rickettsiales bacterium]|nr:NAD(P)/FAD-dependent oxidoreductase [Rickettsiales bacterium]